MWFDDIFIFYSQKAGIVLGRNAEYDPHNDAYSVAVIFQAGEPVRLQIVDAETKEVNFFIISEDKAHYFLNKFLTGIVESFNKENVKTVLPG